MIAFTFYSDNPNFDVLLNEQIFTAYYHVNMC